MTSLIARTGRVQDWIDNPDGRLPVSCTVFDCLDSMEGRNGIQSSWIYSSFALRNAAGVAVHLSKLRPKNTDNGKGLVSSGPVSFGKILSSINETLRRGGLYKSGAIVLHINLEHDDIMEFITTPRDELPWVKRCVDLDEDMWNAAPAEVKDALLFGIKSGDIWLNKIKYNKLGEQVFGNVCLEVYIQHRGTCLLQHVSLGACDFDDIPNAFTQGMTELCELHGKTGVGESGEYLSPEVDRQVGLGMLGLANLLRRYGITYEQFGRALEYVNTGQVVASPAYELALQLQKGINQSADIARSYNMERAFAIAPTASCSYRSKDLDGFTSAPEIAPPISRTVDRDSGTFGVSTYEYGDVEIAEEVGYEVFRKVADEIMKMLDKTGLLHGYSMNWWSDMVEMNEAFVEDWLDSPQTSLYYALQVMSNIQDKSSAYALLDEKEIDDYIADLFLNETPTESNTMQCDCQE